MKMRWRLFTEENGVLGFGVVEDQVEDGNGEVECGISAEKMMM